MSELGIDRTAQVSDQPRAVSPYTGVIVDAPSGPVQTAAFEIAGGVIRALYVVRNPDKLRHPAAASAPRERDRG